MVERKKRPEHTPRLSHNWDIDPEKEALVCTGEESLYFAPKVYDLATCGGFEIVKNEKGRLEQKKLPPGCGAEVPLAVYKEYSSRWTEVKDPQYWVVDKVFNEVVAPCACRRDSLRRRMQHNYKGLTGEPLPPEEVEALIKKFAPAEAAVPG